MKLKKIFGAAIFVSALMCATSVYAAGETFEIGTPIDLSTGEEVTDLQEGQLVAYPVDIKTDSTIVSYQIFMNYDSDVFSVGIEDSAITDAQYDVIDGLGELSAKNSEGIDGAIFSIGESGRKGFSAYGNCYYNTKAENDAYSIGWTDTEARTVSADTAEFYALFTVKKSVGSDELNKVLISPISEKSEVGVYNVGAKLESAPAEVKANACYGAFKVVLDNDSEDVQSLGWIQKLSAQITSADGSKTTTVDLTEYVNEDGSTVYEFPVRIVSNSANASSAKVEIYADVTSDEAGTQDKDTVLVASTTVSLAGTATSYTELGK
jgi:hypothetical protein